jgi:hypothetical protein
MKTKLFLTMLFAALLVSQPTFANPSVDEDAIVKVEVKGSIDSKLLLVDLSNLQTEYVSISILDGDEHVLYSEKVSNVKSFTKKFNLWKLQEGFYTLKVAQSKFKTVQPFEVTSKNVIVDESVKKVNFEPIFKFKDSKLEVNAPLSENDVIVSIMDKAGIEVFSEVNKNTLSFRKRYDLSKLPKGEYLVEVTLAGETFYHNIKQ